MGIMVVVEIGHDDHRSEHDQGDDEDAEGEGQEIAGLIKALSAARIAARRWRSFGQSRFSHTLLVRRNIFWTLVWPLDFSEIRHPQSWVEPPQPSHSLACLFQSSSKRIANGGDAQSIVEIWKLAQNHCCQRRCFAIAASEKMGVCHRILHSRHVWIERT
jgi:hypothetical protein